jgi:hypothetical protein
MSTYVINTETDLEVWTLEELERFLHADQSADELICQPPTKIINPALGLRLLYKPYAYCCKADDE